MEQINITELLQNSEFINFLCYKEDKWLQNVEMKVKLIAIFGSIEKAIIEFNNDDVFNSKNFK